jgi:hypothetical protein
MKRVIYVLSAAALLTVGIIACSKESQQIEKLSYDKLSIETSDKKVNPEVGFTIKCDIARPKFDCLKGTWLCDCTIEFDVDFGFVSGGSNGGSSNPTKRDRASKVGFEVGNYNRKKYIVVDFLQNDHVVKGENVFYSESGENYALPREISSRLGYKELVLKAGEYEINYDRNPNGSVIIELAKAVK